MITVLSAGFKHGYTGHDHLITGRECEAVIGRTFRCVSEARTAAERAAERESDQRVSSAPIELEIQFASGVIRWV